ncbi:LysR family transcriptional regulator [Kitasatospora sp. CMC57]|uniref:LysR family transcriptional regulator n=1 Tax=Kitasatospora sp. CMC57 TaxID=3231513 RepID=A0AB33K872_9ACTN
MRVAQSNLDLNLLIALDLLLEEGSVSGAARRMHLSEPAMSRTLGRIRRALGDPVLVRAGRAMVPTPHALSLRDEVRAVVERAQALFTPTGEVDLGALSRTFTVLAHDAFAALYGAPLLARAAAEAPGVRLRILADSHLDAPTLREGGADLEVGVIGATSPEVHVEHLFEDRILGVARPGHPLLTDGPVTPERFAAAPQLSVSRRGRLHGPIDTALAELGLSRRVSGSAPAFPAAMFMLRDSDLVGLAHGRARGLTDALGLTLFEIPLELPPLLFGLAWHPRHDADPAHAWLRGRIRELMTAPAGETRPCSGVIG